MQTKTSVPRLKYRRHERFAWLIAKNMDEVIASDQVIPSALFTM
jgi:hypothetical protein